MKLEIKPIIPTSNEAKRLFKLLDAHNTTYHPPEECHLTQPNELKQVSSILLGMFCDGVLCGMGGLKFIDDYAEVSRMYILEEHRGKGLAVRLLNALEREAASKGQTLLKLETSDKFESAYRLYLKYGFNLCEPFGEYIHEAYQHTYMEKRIN